ncbi:TlpA family protein disulfide reductase [Colwellia sp. MSW7]|uniref:TlpA family protein disulfide reductase n=1 Tax=Colwellia maritima TaxID=2912588 RepID=A0ABS9WYS0_9GAMM|nr:TlpA disulfide reductase family protein [Colwellia maritima]MCI2283132.1 TlpA family protein disulfide reductase [Colwellia maritima]
MKILTLLKSAPYLLLICILWGFSANSTDYPTAPTWQLHTQNGENISLSDYQGKPVILHFWATWCPYCKKLQPKLVALEEKYQKSGIKLIAISFNEDEDAQPQDEINARGYHFITAVNGESVAMLYGVRGTPTTFFINRQGKAIYKSTSSDINNPKLMLAVEEIIKP